MLTNLIVNRSELLFCFSLFYVPFSLNCVCDVFLQCPFFRSQNDSSFLRIFKVQFRKENLGNSYRYECTPARFAFLVTIRDFVAFFFRVLTFFFSFFFRVCEGVRQQLLFEDSGEEEEMAMAGASCASGFSAEGT